MWVLNENFIPISGMELIKKIKMEVVLSCIDEAHTCLQSEWGKEEMRGDMSRAPAFLRVQVQSATKAPVLAMTASAKTSKTKSEQKSEIEEIATICSIHNSKYMTISISPILTSQIYVRIQKPPASRGFDGIICHSTRKEVKTGSVEVLKKVYLKHFIACINAGKKPKRAIIYVRKLEHLTDLNLFLRDNLGHLEVVNNPQTCPWVINSSCAGRVTIQKIRERSADPAGNIYLYVTTSVMLLGLNMMNVPIVILYSPFNSLNSFIQAGGRAGRRGEDGVRTKSVVYALYNSMDIRKNHPSLQSSVRDFYQTKTCLKKAINSMFSFSECPQQNIIWCCSNCNEFP